MDSGTHRQVETVSAKAREILSRTQSLELYFQGS